VEKILAAGFEGVNLGSRILRVENALTALVAKLY
jgi:16S rRNA U1498 N3-methylase RsmE